jgi:predicted transcriptional regulator
MDDYSLTINNKEVFEFYTKYGINFEQINILFFNILQQIITSTDNSFNSNIASMLLSKISNIEQTITKQQTDFFTKINDYKKDYLNDIKLILLSNNIEHVAPLIKETNNNLIDKTTLVINELIPKNQTNITKDIDSHFKLLQSQLSNETNKLLSCTINHKTIDDFITNSNNSMNQTLNTLTNIITSTESRLQTNLTSNSSKIDEIQLLFNDNKNSNSKLQFSVTEMLKKFEKGSGKGNVSENVVYNILLSLFPCAQIDYVGNEIKETGDIILVRNNKPKILIENKDHDSCNVPKQDIDKFIRDCEIQKCCGIMFAQNRGIANKENFEIQINNGNILLYVHNVKFDSDKIKTSIEIVEQFKIKFDEINIDNDICTIDTSTLEEINKEFNSYTTQKHSLLKLVKEFTDKINSSIAELKMPNLEQFLSKHYATSSNQGENVCKYCEKFVPKSLSQHYRYCSDKKAFDDALVQKQNIKITPIDDLNLCIQDKPSRSHKKK